MRHDAYHQFVLWRHGKLGIGNRRVILSCCVWQIRQTFPSENGQYTGLLCEKLSRHIIKLPMTVFKPQCFHKKFTFELFDIIQQIHRLNGTLVTCSYLASLRYTGN